MATYNGAKYIREQLDSILAQSHSNIEVVVCDDGSTDETVAIVNEYVRQGYNIRLHQNETNLGFVKNFEKAVSFCTGDYIALADQDDIWLEHKLSTLLELIQKSGAGLVYSNAHLIDEQGNRFDTLQNVMPVNYIRGKACYGSFYLDNCVTGCTAMFDRKLLANAMPFPDWIEYHDQWLAYVATRFETGIDFTEEPLIEYRQHADNVVGVRGKQQNVRFYFQKHLNRIKKIKKKNEKTKRLLSGYEAYEKEHGLDTALIEKMIAKQDAYATRFCKFSLSEFFDQDAYEETRRVRGWKKDVSKVKIKTLNSLVFEEMMSVFFLKPLAKALYYTVCLFKLK